MRSTYLSGVDPMPSLGALASKGARTGGGEHRGRGVAKRSLASGATKRAVCPATYTPTLPTTYPSDHKRHKSRAGSSSRSGAGGPMTWKHPDVREVGLYVGGFLTNAAGARDTPDHAAQQAGPR